MNKYRITPSFHTRVGTFIGTDYEVENFDHEQELVKLMVGIRENGAFIIKALEGAALIPGELVKEIAVSIDWDKITSTGEGESCRTPGPG